jgi:hypothetical protein
MLATRRDMRRMDARIQFTHGGFNGPYGKKVKTVWTQEGRTRKGQTSGNAHGEESQARRKAEEQRAEDDGAQEDRAQEDRAQSRAEEGGSRHAGDADAVIVVIDGTAACSARGTEAADARAKPAAAGGTAAAAADNAVLRLVLSIDTVILAEAVGQLVVDAAEAARQQLGRRQRLQRRLELLADLHLPLSGEERGNALAQWRNAFDALRRVAVRCSKRKCPACALEEEVQAGRPRGPVRQRGLDRREAAKPLASLGPKIAGRPS